MKLQSDLIAQLKIFFRNLTKISSVCSGRNINVMIQLHDELHFKKCHFP